MFKNGGTKVPDNFKSELDKKFPDLFENSIGMAFATRSIDGQFFICFTCNNYIKNGKVPPMSNQNDLQLFDLTDYDELKLSELESCMIALNIIFQKVFRLPKSRWPAMKDRTVNIPIFE